MKQNTKVGGKTFSSQLVTGTSQEGVCEAETSLLETLKTGYNLVF